MRQQSTIIGFTLLVAIIVCLFILYFCDTCTIYYGQINNKEGVVSNLVSDNGDIVENYKISKQLQNQIQIGDYIYVKLTNKKSNIVKENQISEEELSKHIKCILNG